MPSATPSVRPDIVPSWHARLHPPHPRSSAKRRSRPQRWRDAVAELLALQAEYAEWLEALPDSLRDSAIADALEAITGLDLQAIADIEPPKGYGRD